MNRTRFILIFLVLLISSVSTSANEISLDINYNKTKVSQNGGYSAHLNIWIDNRIKTSVGFKHLGSLSYQESFGLINYKMSQLETSVGFSLLKTKYIDINANVGSAFGLSTVSLSAPPLGHDGYITRVFYPSFITSLQTHYYVIPNISIQGGFALQSPSFKGDQPWLNQLYLGVGLNKGKVNVFKSSLAFSKKVSSKNILKKVEACYLCMDKFYALLIGEFSSEVELLNALEHAKINALLSTNYYLTQPQPFYYYSDGIKYYLFFGEFRKEKQAKKWFLIWANEILLKPKLKIVSLRKIVDGIKVKPILFLIK
ncbi:MAG: hypothetical protein HRU38_20410 [Saccharospirillaceae bacterium]|nr:hypothetical protein [Pseudomonadales bacterium]NRB80996.1 hypothetical protein [Saccharospirillaceae bacterium]